MKHQGTPATMKEAIENGLDMCPLNLVVANVQAHVRDYLAQRFGAAMLEPGISAEESLRLERLFKEITKADCGPLDGEKE